MEKRSIANSWRQRRNALRCERWLWPLGLVPFEIHVANTELVSQIEDGMREIEAVSCIRFVKRGSHLKGKYVRIVESESVPTGVPTCKSSVGSAVPHPKMQLSEGCSRGQILHELLHGK